MSDAYVAEVDFASGRSLAPPLLATERFAGSNSGASWSPDGRQLAFLSQRRPGAWGTRVICLRDTKTGEVREIASKFQRVVSIRWLPDGRSLLGAGQSPGGQYGAFVIDLQSGEYQPAGLTRPSPVGTRAAWSADGKRMFYGRWGPDPGVSSIVARDLESGQERQIHRVNEPAVYLCGLSISPDGERLAIVARDGESAALRHVIVVPTAGGEGRTVLSSTQLAWPVSIAWAPDGQGVLFVKQPDTRVAKMELWLAPLEGGEPRKLDLTAPNLRDLSVHPDGRHLAYTAGASRSAVWILENFLPAGK